MRVQPATYVRGGTSKCWIFRASQLPRDQGEIERVLIRSFGSPDPRQIDGVGGATSTTSKAIVVDDTETTGPVSYRFAQVSIETPTVEWDSNCGNCATGLALFVLHAGLRPTSPGATRVVIRNIITGLELSCEIQTPNGAVPEYGDRVLDGQYYPGVPVDVVFEQSSWTTFRAELPTAHVIDTVRLDDREYRATLIDAGAPAALFDITSFPAGASDLQGGIDHLLENAGRLRAAAAALMNIPSHLSSIPKVGIIGPPPAGAVGLTARMISMNALHPAIGLTSAVAIGAALAMPDSVPRRYAITEPPQDDKQTVSIHLPDGIALFELDQRSPTTVRFQRTARILSESNILVPPTY
ncbi:MAG: PrpF domain-containing protein [Lacisediminihabitans sp.]